MKKYLGILFVVISIGCSESKSKKIDSELLTEIEQKTSHELTSQETTFQKINSSETTSQDTIQKEASFKIYYDSKKISTFTIEDSEKAKTKTLVRKLSEYSTKELEELPNSKRLTLSIVVPYDISKENLDHTLKSIVSDKTEKDNDIDEIIIFAYDDKNDIGKTQYTFGKLLWAPNGKTGNVTPEIAINNNRNNYKFDIIIKEKVGNIQKSDLPTERELMIYNEMMDEKYIDMQEEDYHPSIMKKFNIKTKKKLDAIWLKVAVYKW
jgi:hypothetical protein